MTMRDDDINPETVYTLVLLMLFGADFDRNNNCFWEVSNLFGSGDCYMSWTDNCKPTFI